LTANWCVCVSSRTPTVQVATESDAAARWNDVSVNENGGGGYTFNPVGPVP
jgi:hypothetical protein